MLFPQNAQCVCSSKSDFSEPSSNQIELKVDNGADFGHFQFRRADNFWICQIVFHFSTQYQNRPAHFLFFAQTAIYFSCQRLCLSSAMPMSSLLIFGSLLPGARMKKYYRFSSIPPTWCMSMNVFFFFFSHVWEPTQPERSVCVQLRCCQRWWPCYRCLVANL